MSTPSHDSNAEASLLGAMLLNPDAVAVGRARLRADDFYNPAHGHIFSAILDVHAAGHPVDPVTVADRLRTVGLADQVGGPAKLVSLQAQTPALSNADRYASIVGEHAARRTIASLFAALTDSAAEGASSDALLTACADGLSKLDLPPSDDVDGLVTLDQFLDATDETGSSDWIIPGLMRRSWRVIVVASEGAGKTTLMRQIAVSAAAGVHPFTHRPQPPVRVLTVDGENPREAITDTCEPMRVVARDHGHYDPTRHWLLHRMNGIDLRTRRGRNDLEAAVASAMPDLVVMGPLYKMFQAKASEGWDGPAKEVADVLDDLRVRYGFGLLLEAHAPHGEKKDRDLRPEGSNLWRKWPEIGLSLTPIVSEPGDLHVRRFRGDRLVNEWPTELHRSRPWPWAGSWGAGVGAPSVPNPAAPERDEPVW